MKIRLLLPAFLLLTHFAWSQTQDWQPSGTTNIVYTAGLVGIGTSTPQSPLHVKGQILADLTNLPAFVSTSPLGVVIQQGNQGGDFVNASSYYSIFAHNIHFDGTNWIRRNQYSNCWATVMNHNYYDVSFALNNPSGGSYQSVTPTSYMRILASDNVLIGKTTQNNSGYILDVNGTTRANAVVVNTSGADYVFQPGYTLMPLPALAQYVQTNHHLPDVPSAQEMSKNGLNVGDNQTMLLRKIEELTLYMIEQQNQMVEQQKQIDQLKKQNKKLETLVKNMYRKCAPNKIAHFR